jgi:nucleotide-binding universal stress UspA family protein
VYSTVLVPLDTSDFSEAAVPVGAAIAQRLGAALRLVHVVPRAASAERRADQPPQPEQGSDDDSEGAAHLKRVADRVDRERKLSVERDVLEGDVVSTLMETAERHGPTLIVTTTRGRGGLQRAVLGSVADALIRRSGSPVLAVRPSPQAARLAEDRTERVLLPLDGTQRDEEILEHARVIGRAMKAELLLLRVVQPQHDTSRPPVQQIDRIDLRHQREEAQTYLRRVAEHLGQAAVSTTAHVVVDDDPAQAILEFGRKNDVDLIAMATRGRSGLARVREGSVADRVLRGTDAPVLLFRVPSEVA